MIEATAVALSADSAITTASLAALRPPSSSASSASAPAVSVSRATLDASSQFGLQNPAVVRSSALSSPRSEEHTSELQSRENLVCRLLLEKKKRRPAWVGREEIPQLP